jgi:hypothetical protein
MRKFLLVPALTLIMAASLGSAFASDDDDDNNVSAPGSNWMTVAQITEKFTSEGYDVRRVKIEDSGYELYAIDKDGKRVEAYVDPVSGAVLKHESDD